MALVVLLPAIIVVAGFLAAYIYDAETRFQVVWKDFGLVTNLHDVLGWTNIGAMYFQNMTINTQHHGNINFYTGGGQMCSLGVVPGCGSGSVNWNNGTEVFIQQLNGGGLYVGAVSR